MKLGWLEAAVLSAASVASASVCLDVCYSVNRANSILQKDLAYSPPYYPSPWTTGAGDWEDAYKRAVEFVSGLSLAEKVNLTTGAG